MTLLTRSDDRLSVRFKELTVRAKLAYRVTCMTSRPEVDCLDADVRKSESQLRGGGDELIEGGGSFPAES